MIKVVAFDVGHTLIKYDTPLNWASLYRHALCKIATDCNMVLSDCMIGNAIEILTKYNTRINYREIEVVSNTIFNEIITAWNCSSANIHAIKSAFYSFFQVNAYPFPETIETLKVLKNMGIKIAVLTDVAYGMDNEFSLKDFKMLSEYIDLTLTSVDVGYRKPNKSGFLKIVEYFYISPNEMIYVGDEEKDILGANNIRAVSVLINRSDTVKEFSQNHTISSLDELFGILNDFNFAK